MNGKYAIIDNCRQADIKAGPRLGAETLFIVKRGTKCMLDLDEKVKGYSKIYFDNGSYGYCVNKFVKII